MTKERLYLVAERISEKIGADTLLNELLGAMDYDELKANLEFIDRMHDTDEFIDFDMNKTQNKFYDSFINLWGEEFAEEAESLAMRYREAEAFVAFDDEEVEEAWERVTGSTQNEFEHYVHAYTYIEGVYYVFY